MVDKRMKPRVLFIYDPNSRGALRVFSRSVGEDDLMSRSSREYGYEPARETEFFGMRIEITEYNYREHDYLEKQEFSGYSIVCLCLHRGGSKDEFETFVAKCQEAGAIPIGVADSTYYNSEKVVPEVEGLTRCLSDDLREVLQSHLR